MYGNDRTLPVKNQNRQAHNINGWMSTRSLSRYQKGNGILRLLGVYTNGGYLLFIQRICIYQGDRRNRDN